MLNITGFFHLQSLVESRTGVRASVVVFQSQPSYNCCNNTWLKGFFLLFFQFVANYLFLGTVAANF